MNDTFRTYPRGLREAFPHLEQTETAIGIAGPVVIPTKPPLWVRLIRWALQR